MSKYVENRPRAERYEDGKRARERCTREWHEHEQKQGRDTSYREVEKWVHERADRQDRIQGKE